MHYQSKNILSVSVFYYRYTLGAHGHTLQKVYNLNLQNGEIISLPVLLKDMEDYKKIINREIKKQIKLNPQIYFDNGEIFKTISDDQTFYIIEDGMSSFLDYMKLLPMPVE